MHESPSIDIDVNHRHYFTLSDIVFIELNMFNDKL